MSLLDYSCFSCYNWAWNSAESLGGEMRAFTFGIHFINTINGVVEPVKQGTQSCITMESCYFNSAPIYSYYLYSVLLLWLFILCSNIFILFILLLLLWLFQLLFQHIFYYLFYCCEDFDQSIQSCKQWSHNSFVIFHLHFLLRYLNWDVFWEAETHGLEKNCSGM